MMGLFPVVKAQLRHHSLSVSVFYNGLVALRSAELGGGSLGRIISPLLTPLSMGFGALWKG